ncbi:MAG TPA: GIY-YIG nuclease family protein, partial [Bacteroidia bacterium]|nr:GIY-YIG nuclease family protein [Bacteroidia bacterium]
FKKVNMNIVYALYCPEKKTPKYVGKTTTGLGRPVSHIKNVSHNMDVINWVRELELKRLTPMIVILENDIKKELLDDREKFWIKYFIDKGFHLFNINYNTKKQEANKKNGKCKIGVSLKFEETTIDTIEELLKLPENLKLKGKFTPMLEHLIETHPEL